jgi:hypothetical protein
MFLQVHRACSNQQQAHTRSSSSGQGCHHQQQEEEACPGCCWAGAQWVIAPCQTFPVGGWIWCSTSTWMEYSWSKRYQYRVVARHTPHLLILLEGNEATSGCWRRRQDTHNLCLLQAGS